MSTGRGDATIDVPGLPAAVRQRAAALLDGTLDVVPLRDAATVALVRDGPQGLEVFVQRRTSTLVFAAGMYVFPGGRVEEQDMDPRVPFIGEPPDPTPFAVGGDIVLGLPAPTDPQGLYRSLLAAAVRETLEESGVLLAQTATGTANADDARRVRDALLSGVPLAKALGEAGAAVPFDALMAFSHWMTPAVEVRRFDTRFFVARVPADQIALSASGETDEAGWFTPALMLQRAANGEVYMLPPTVAALTALAAQTDARSAVAGHRRGIRPVLPHPKAEGGEINWRLLDGYTGLPLAAP